jgi:hypothetical protein
MWVSDEKPRRDNWIAIMFTVQGGRRRSDHPPIR